MRKPYLPTEIYCQQSRMFLFRRLRFTAIHETILLFFVSFVILFEAIGLLIRRGAGQQRASYRRQLLPVEAQPAHAGQERPRPIGVGADAPQQLPEGWRVIMVGDMRQLMRYDRLEHPARHAAER